MNLDKYLEQLDKIPWMSDSESIDTLAEYLFGDMSNKEYDERMFALDQWWFERQRNEECAPDWHEDYKFWH
jgi:hypothetical protein